MKKIFPALSAVLLGFTAADAGPLPVVQTLPASNIGGLAATAHGQLVELGDASAAADMTLYWGTTYGGDDPGEWNGTPVTLAGLEAAGVYDFPLAGLWYDTEYHCRVMGANGDGSQWAGETITFTTLGKPWFDSVSATVPAIASDSIEMTAEVGYCGPAPATVYCYFGPDPGNMALASTWSNQTGTPTLTHMEVNLQTGGQYWYAFLIESSIANTSWTVWSATNTLTLSGLATWVGEGDWHAATNWSPGLPGPGATANFYKSGATVTALADLTVAQAMVNTAGTTTFDLGNNSLIVTGRFDVGGNAASGYPAENRAVAKITSGTLEAGTGTITVGANSYHAALMLEGDSALIANALTVTSPSSSQSGNTNLFLVTGPGARVQASTLTVTCGHNNHLNHIILRGCTITNNAVTIANYATVILENAGMRVNGSISASHNTRSAKLQAFNSFIDVTGDYAGGREGMGIGSNLLLSNSVMHVGRVLIGMQNGFSANNTVNICPASRLKSTGDTIMTTYGGVNNRIIVNGVFEVGGNVSINDSNSNGIIVSNGVFSVAGTTTISNNRAATQNYVAIHGPDARFTTSRLVIGNVNNNYFSHNNYFHLNGGQSTVLNDATIGHVRSQTNRFIVGAATSRFAAKSLVSNNHSVFEFTIPDEGFAQVPVSITNTASIDDTTRFVINVDRFIGKAVLMEAASIPAINEGNVTINHRRGTQARVFQTGSSLGINVINISFFMIR